MWRIWLRPTGWHWNTRYGESAAFNLGNGNGYSVRQVIETAMEVTGYDFPVELEPRRPGDPAVLVADSRAAREELGWQPLYEDLKQIVRHAWIWEQQKGVKW